MKVVIISGTVYGGAESVAQRAKEVLLKAGHEALYNPRATLDWVLEQAPQALLGVTSTTGLGELPDDIETLYQQLRDTLPMALRGLPGAVIALGDMAYDDTFCAGGEQLQALFDELGLRLVQPMLRLDASETVNQEDEAQPWISEFAAGLQA